MTHRENAFTQTSPRAPKKVSVIIPTYNRAQLVRQTVESILAQTYPSVEIIVVDDGSPDDTRQVLAPYVGRIQYYYQENQGAERAANFGFECSTGDYILFFDHDDLMFPTKIEKQAAVLDRDPTVAICDCYYHYIDVNNRWLEKYHLLPTRDILRELVTSDFIWSGGPLMRRECLVEVGLHDESLWTSDWDMWLRFALKGYTFACVPEPLGAYRILSNSQISNIDAVEKGSNEIIQKIFSDPQLPPDLLPLKQGIQAQTLIQSACWYSMNEDWEKARTSLRRALELSPESSHSPRSLLMFLVREAVNVRMRQPPIKFIVEVFDHLLAPFSLLTGYQQAAVDLTRISLALKLEAAGQTDEAQRVLSEIEDITAILTGLRAEVTEQVSRLIMLLPVNDATSLAHAFFNHLPQPALPLLGIKAKVSSAVYIDQAQREFHAQFYRRAFLHVLRGIGFRPGCIQNRGVQSVLIKSFFKIFKKQNRSPDELFPYKA